MKERNEMSPRRGSALLQRGNGRKEGRREGNYYTAAQEGNCSETKDQGMKGPSATYRQRERRAGCRARCDLKTRSQTQQKIRLS